ncbi:molybdate ABC transporter substrate-binding protein [Psychromicrobium lacuslunae]|uniref:molybdate ABC transporter substrate-binding protein n=1 Tax=Psychromicrobium lacuslunae TaxID=1618207 RepID=UPI000695CE86|nr:molybdate ABC transporter substrate-binding protein [Psychromicrobium lacuslunae]
MTFHRFRSAGKVVSLLVAASALAWGVSACSPSPADSAKSGEVTVFAAASLTEVMKTLTDTYHQQNSGTNFTLSYAASSQLVQQLSSGAKADILVTADEASIASIATKTSEPILSGGTTIIASNKITLAIAPGNPGKISSLQDAAASSKVAVCAPSVPCGRAAQRVLDAAKLSLKQPSQENDVKAVLTKVSTGQVDAGFVYSTDAKAAASQGVSSVELNDLKPNKYPLALTVAGANNAAAKAFRDWLAGSEAAQILAQAGFGPASASTVSSTSSTSSSSPSSGK